MPYAMSDQAKTFAQIGGPQARRHLFLCVGPDCCSSEQGLATWEHLKSEVKRRDLAWCLACGGVGLVLLWGDRVLG